MKTGLFLVALIFAAGVAVPAAAQTESELRQQLDAQKAINEQLRRRVQELERQLAGAPSAPALKPLERRAAAAEEVSPRGTTAIEEALVAKGVVLIPPGSFRLAPGFTWAHSGASALRTRIDSYVASLTADAGLPWGMAVSANVPYVYRDTSFGSNSGLGDFSLAVSKKLTDESDFLRGMPSWVASLSYLEKNGEDPFGPIPIGSGFRALAGTLSAVKRIDPVALYGNLTFAHAFASDVNAPNFLGEASFRGRIAPGNTWGYRLGASLAATPAISFDASLSGSFSRSTDVNSVAFGAYTLPNSTTVFFNLGAGFLLARNLSLLLNAAAGATKDSPDFIFSLSLPYRF